MVIIIEHAHFLLRSGPGGIAALMRRLLTGYAVSYNRRHKRHGQLFQNRYKFIICREDIYMRKLVRYIQRMRLAGQDRIKSDQRILGESGFVGDVLSESEASFSRRYKLKSQGFDFEKVIERVSTLLQVEKDYITGDKKTRLEGPPSFNVSLNMLRSHQRLRLNESFHTFLLYGRK